MTTLDAREMGTVLAGLRLWQATMVDRNWSAIDLDLVKIATKGGAHMALSPDEVDDLCGELNTTDARPCKHCGEPEAEHNEYVLCGGQVEDVDQYEAGGD